jgi:hypothetical protein
VHLVHLLKIKEPLPLLKEQDGFTVGYEDGLIAALDGFLRGTG